MHVLDGSTSATVFQIQILLITAARNWHRFSQSTNPPHKLYRHCMLGALEFHRCAEDAIARQVNGSCTRDTSSIKPKQ